MNVADANAGTERRLNRFSRDDIDSFDLCLRHVQFGARAIQFHLGGGARLDSLHSVRKVRASATCASCAFSSASSTETSSATSTVPGSTICPGASATSRMVPQFVAQRDRSQRYNCSTKRLRADAPVPPRPPPLQTRTELRLARGGLSRRFHGADLRSCKEAGHGKQGHKQKSGRNPSPALRSKLRFPVRFDSSVIAPGNLLRTVTRNDDSSFHTL